MGCHPSKLTKKSKVKPFGQFGSMTAVDNKKKLNRTTSKPTDFIVEESVAPPNQNVHVDEENDGENTVAERQTFFGTDVSVEWLVKILCDYFKCPTVAKPQWILERLNNYTEKDLDHTRVLRITFGWGDVNNLPRSVVLKISPNPSDDQTPENKLALRMFKKECNVYEWLKKQKKVSAPEVFVIQKVQTEECQELLILMEDISERAIPVDLGDEISVEAIRDLLRLLAKIHAASRLQQSEWVNVIRANTAQFYRGSGLSLIAIRSESQSPFKELADFIETVASGWAEMGEARFKKLLELISASYMAKTVNSACKKMKCEPCLVHGNPISRNFFLENRRETAAIIDWTQVHPGCFAEDVTKAICWNLTPKERHTHAKKLLEFYHFSFLKYSGDTAKEANITLETVENGYRHFFPLAAVTYLMFLPEDQQKADPRMLERAQSLIDESLNLFASLIPLQISEEEEEDSPSSTPLN